MAGYGRNSLVATLVLLLTLSGAARAAPASGTLVVDGVVLFDGVATIQSASGAFFLGVDATGENAAERAVVALATDAARANVTRVTVTQRLLDTPVSPSPFTSNSITTESIDFERATLNLRADGALDGARLVLESTTFHETDTTFTLANDGYLRGVDYFFGVLGARAGSATPEHEEYAVDYNFVQRGTFETSSTNGATLSYVADQAWLYVYGYDLDVATRDGTVRFETGESVTSDVEGADALGVRTKREATFLLVRLDGAAGSIQAEGARARWFEPDPVVNVDGAVIAKSATGTIRVAATTYRADRESVLMQGQVALSPERVPSGKAKGDNWDARADSQLRSEVAGDVQYISVASAPPGLFDPATAAAVATGVTLLTLLLVFWQSAKWWSTVFLLPLYTRLKEPEILDNEVRNQIYEIIRTNPGISARAVHRAAGQSWGTVVYHLRQLERHHLVTSKRVGRSRNFYENHGKYRGMEVELATLKAPRAAQVAHLILREPGLTQERLTELSGLPQPTTSYYVRKLKEAKLIEDRREGRYVRYFPQGELAKLLQIAVAESSPGAPPPADVLQPAS